MLVQLTPPPLLPSPSPHTSRLNGFFTDWKITTKLHVTEIDSGRGKNSGQLIPATKLSSLTVYIF